MLQSLKKLNRLLHRIPAWVVACGLAALWLAVQIHFFQSSGVRFVPDSTIRYIPYARHVAEAGGLSESQENRYILYILYLAFFIKLKLGFGAAILAQTAISGVACALVYDSAKSISRDNRAVASATAVLFILWKDIQYLNAYVLTESLFTSSILVVLHALIKGNRRKDYVMALVLSLIPTLLRPNGFTVLLGVVACVCYSSRSLILQHKRVIVVSALAAFALLLAVLDRYLLTTFQIVETYFRGEIIYASDIYAVAAKNIVLPNETASPVLRILFFILSNPVFFAKIFFLKLMLFIGYAKPYYSSLHKLLIFCVIYPLYFFTGRYILKGSRLAGVKAFVPVVFLLQAGIVAATSEDWDSRFIVPLLPMVMLFGMAGVYEFLRQKVTTPPAPTAPESRRCPADHRYAQR